MKDKGFVENGFIVDLSNSQNAAEIIYELSSILDMPEAKNKRICLKLGHIDLSSSQLLSIKSLIESMVSTLAFIDTTSSKTESSALNLGIIVSELSNEIKVPEVEMDVFEIAEDKPQERIQEGYQESMSAISYEILDHEPLQKTEMKAEKIEDELQPKEAIEEIIKETVDEPTEEKLEKTGDILEVSKLPTLYLQQTLRSGQTISYDGNIVVIGDANPGSEIIAKGDITIWGVLAGIAHAGARGNDFAKIRALKINAIQLRISGFYARRPDTLNIPFIQRTNEFTPEEARVENKAISIHKTYDNK